MLIGLCMPHTGTSRVVAGASGVGRGGASPGGEKGWTTDQATGSVKVG